jgi:hypothetical protein
MDLVVADVTEVLQVVIVTLYNPVYDAAAKILNYTVTYVPGHHNSTIANFYRRYKNLPMFTKVCFPPLKGTALLLLLLQMLRVRPRIIVRAELSTPRRGHCHRNFMGM